MFRSGPEPPHQPVIDLKDRRYKTAFDEFPAGVVPADSLAGLFVYCFARTTGLQRGKIGKPMANVRMYRRSTHSKSWLVEGGCK